MASLKKPILVKCWECRGDIWYWDKEKFNVDNFMMRAKIRCRVCRDKALEKTVKELMK